MLSVHFVSRYWRYYLTLWMKLSSMWRDLCLMVILSLHLLGDNWRCRFFPNHDPSLIRHKMASRAQSFPAPKSSPCLTRMMARNRLYLQCRCSPGKYKKKLFKKVLHPWYLNYQTFQVNFPLFFLPLIIILIRYFEIWITNFFFVTLFTKKKFFYLNQTFWYEKFFFHFFGYLTSMQFYLYAKWFVRIVFVGYFYLFWLFFYSEFEFFAILLLDENYLNGFWK